MFLLIDYWLISVSDFLERTVTCAHWMKLLSHSQLNKRLSCYRTTANLLTLNSSKTDILLHRTQKPTRQNTQLFTWHLPLCSKSWLYLWRTSCLLWPNYSSLQSLLLSHSSASRYPALLDSSTTCTIATSVVHSKLDYCNSLL